MTTTTAELLAYAERVAARSLAMQALPPEPPRAPSRLAPISSSSSSSTLAPDTHPRALRGVEPCGVDAVEVWAELMPASRLVLDVLLRLAHQTGVAYPSAAWLAERCRLTVRTVRRALAELVAAGLIERRARHRRNGSQATSTTRVVRRNRQNRPPSGVGGGDRIDTPLQGSLSDGVTGQGAPVERSKTDPSGLNQRTVRARAQLVRLAAALGVAASTVQGAAVGADLAAARLVEQWQGGTVAELRDAAQSYYGPHGPRFRVPLSVWILHTRHRWRPLRSRRDWSAELGVTRGQLAAAVEAAGERALAPSLVSMHRRGWLQVVDAGAAARIVLRPDTAAACRWARRIEGHWTGPDGVGLIVEACY